MDSGGESVGYIGGMTGGILWDSGDEAAGIKREDWRDNEGLWG